MANLISRRRFTIERPRRHCLQRSLFRILEAALGIKPPDLAAALGIAGIPLGDAGARFLAPARFGDVVEMTSQVSEFRRSSFDVEHRLFVAGAVAVEGRETRVWAAPDPADPSKMKSQPFRPALSHASRRDCAAAIGRPVGGTFLASRAALEDIC